MPPEFFARLAAGGFPECVAFHLDHVIVMKQPVERGARQQQVRGKRAACAYWLATELPRVHVRIDLVRSGGTSFAAIAPDDF